MTISEKNLPRNTYGGYFSEAASFVRELVSQGEMTRDEALRISEKAYRRCMTDQLAGRPVAERPEELIEDLSQFSRATEAGKIKFSNND